MVGRSRPRAGCCYCIGGIGDPGRCCSILGVIACWAAALPVAFTGLVFLVTPGAGRHVGFWVGVIALGVFAYVYWTEGSHRVWGYWEGLLLLVPPAVQLPFSLLVRRALRAVR